MLTLALANGVYATIVQTKVPQRFHGRVFAFNVLVAWSTIPLGFAVITPVAVHTAEPWLADGGPLATSIGAVIGTGPGRGTALIYLAFGLCIVALKRGRAAPPGTGPLRRGHPDAEPDDLVGLAALRRGPMESEEPLFDDVTEFQVVINHEEQYSIWPADRDRPAGWRPDGFTGSRDACLANIDEVWTDMRPLSARR